MYHDSHNDDKTSVSNRQVSRVAAIFHAEAQCAAHCVKERAPEELNDLIDARFGGAA